MMHLRDWSEVWTCLYAECTLSEMVGCCRQTLISTGACFSSVRFNRSLTRINVFITKQKKVSTKQAHHYPSVAVLVVVISCFDSSLFQLVDVGHPAHTFSRIFIYIFWNEKLEWQLGWQGIFFRRNSCHVVDPPLGWRKSEAKAVELHDRYSMT